MGAATESKARSRVVLFSVGGLGRDRVAQALAHVATLGRQVFVDLVRPVDAPVVA